MQERRFSNRELCALIVPLLFEQFLNLLVGMVDMVMIAGAGEAAMSGVAIVNEYSHAMRSPFSVEAAGNSRASCCSFSRSCCSFHCLRFFSI